MEDIDLKDSKFELINTLRASNDMFDVFYNNKFQEAYSMADQYSSVSMIHAHSKAFLSFLYALMTLEKDEILKAKQDIEESLQFAKKHRKSKSIVQNVTSLLWKADTCKYSDEELHAELVYGECNVMLGLLTFFGDQSIMSLIKGALQMTTANRSFKYTQLTGVQLDKSNILIVRFCNERLIGNKQWDSEELKMQFESGVLNGFGVFNLVLSMIPKKIMRILSIAGFSGDKSLALQYIRKCTELTTGARCRIAVLEIQGFTMYFEQVMGINEIDTEWIKSLLDYWGEKFPKAVFVLFYLAKYHLMRGEPTKAINEYNDCITIQNEWKFIHKICHWELLWCYMTICDWDNAIDEAILLVENSLYSPATNEYQKAVFKMMQMEDSKNENLTLEIDEIMKSVPLLKRRFAGKSIPQEKFICTRAVQYFDENRRDGLIALMELFYIWNYLCFLKSNELADPFLRRINEKLKFFEAYNDTYEQIAFLTLVKGVIFRNLDKDEEAVKNFQDIINSGKVIKKDTFIVPHAVLELGITYLKMREIDESRRYLEKVKSDDYDHYLNESMVNLRVASALRQLDFMENNTRL